MSATDTDDEKFITQLLDESGVGASEPLQDALLELRGKDKGPVTAPSCELAALMVPNVTALRPRRKAGKAATVGIAVVAATGLGVSGVAAANPEFRDAANDAVQQVMQFFDPNPEETPSGSTGEAPAPGKSTDRTTGDGAASSKSVPGPTATPSPDKVAPAEPREHGGDGTERAPARDVTVKAPDRAGEAPLRDSVPRNLDLPGVRGLPMEPRIPGGDKSGDDQPELVPKPTAPQPSEAPDVPDSVQIPAPVDDPTNIPQLPDLKAPSQ